METGGSGSIHKKMTTSCSTPDVISNLPCNVLEKILVCLTVQDAARTSVLSRKWRYIWTTLPRLVFDNKFRGPMRRATTNELMMTIYKVLLLHQGPLLKFTLSCLESCPEIDQLIFFLSKNGIKEFDLLLTFGERSEPYKVPSTLFSCLQLEHLCLCSCVFNLPPGFKGFTRLLSFELYGVYIAGDILSSLISSCLLLERLTIHCFTSLDYLEIVAPNLKLLQCDGLFRSICIRIPHDADVLIVLEESRNHLGLNEEEISNAGRLLCSLPVVTYLALDYSFVKCMAATGMRERLPATLNNLISLQLSEISFGEPDEAFHGGTATIDPVVDLFDLQGWSDVSLNEVRSVIMEEVSGKKAEMEFIRLLLAKCPVLETMAIKLKSEVVAVRLGIVEELTGFRRASAQAVITFPK